ncbi:MAG: hypothetical protein JSV97_00600 [candidate division WOR-3 bacterium]|nr:MAG: hypothetical protein JSV97_00600 [candidate division WOR-3 bacterium]
MKKDNKSVIFLFIGLLIALSDIACESDNADKSFRSFFDPKEIEYEQLCIEMGHAVWDNFLHEDASRLAEAHKRFHEFFSDESLKSQIQYWYRNRGKLGDTVLKRRVELWNNIMIGASVDYSKEIFELRKKIEAALSNPAQVEEAESLEDDALRLMQFRNHKAQDLGFANYADMILEITEIGTVWFDNFISLVDSITLEPYKQLISDLKDEKGLAYVSYADISFMINEYYQNLMKPAIPNEKKMEKLKGLLHNIGIQLDELPVQLQIKDLPAGIGGFGNALVIPGDFRFVVEPELPFKDWVHEIGHGLQWMHTKVQAPVLKGYEWNIGNASDAYMEGMGEIMFYFAGHPYWLQNQAGLTEGDWNDISEILREYAPLWYRLLLVEAITEIEIYRNLDRPAQEIENYLFKEYLLLDEAPGWNKNLATVLYVSFPVYQHNYFVADIIAWQIHEDLSTRFGEGYIYNQEIARYLKDNYWRDGELYNWQERLVKATGKELDVRSFFDNKMD